MRIYNQNMNPLPWKIYFIAEARCPFCMNPYNPNWKCCDSLEIIVPDLKELIKKIAYYKRKEICEINMIFAAEVLFHGEITFIREKSIENCYAVFRTLIHYKVVPRICVDSVIKYFAQNKRI